MGVTKDQVVAGIAKVALIGSALWLFSKAGSSLNVVGNAESFHASGSSSKLMTEKAAINALTTAKGKFMTVTFLKKDGSTRRMRCRTGVKRYVKGVGSPLGSPANRLQKYKLITVYDLDKAGYRSIPVDRVISVKAAGKTFSSKNPKGKQMSAEEYSSYNAEWEAIFETFGRRGYFADLSDDETEGMTDNEIMELVMDEGDLGWEEDPELIPDVLERHAEGTGDYWFEEYMDIPQNPTEWQIAMLDAFSQYEWYEPTGDIASDDLLRGLAIADDPNYHKLYEACAINDGIIDSSHPAEAHRIAIDCWYALFGPDDLDAETGYYAAESFDAEKITKCPDCGSRVQYKQGWIECPNEECEWIDADYEWSGAESFAAPLVCPGCSADLIQVNEYSVVVCKDCGHQLIEQDYYTQEYWGETPPLSQNDLDAENQDMMCCGEQMEFYDDNEPYYFYCPVCEESIETKEFQAPYGGSGALMDIGKDTALGSFSPSELATSSAIHGDFDQASLNYSGAQNIVVRAESDRDEDEEDYEEYLRLQGLCECTACGEVSALSTGTTDKQGLYRCIACVTAKQPSISEEEVVEDIDYLRGIH